MPTYEFEIGGRIYEVQSERMPTAGQMRSIASRMGGGSSTRQPERPYNGRPYSPDEFTERRRAPEGSAVGRFASGAWEMLNPVGLVEGVASAVRRPVETASALVGAQGRQLDKARTAFGEGRYSEALGYGAAGLVPLVGPVAADIGERIGEGDVAGGLGAAAGVLAPTGAAVAAGRKVLGGAARKIPPKAPTARELANAQRSEAVRWALDNGIPVDAATASGNRVVRATKAVADNSLGGALRGQRAAAERSTALAAAGRRLADQVDAVPATAEAAGAAATEGVEGYIRQRAGEASDAYGRVTAKGDPVVDLSGVKPALQPIFDRLARKKELVGQLMPGEGRAAQALDTLVNGADAAPLSVVDAALGDLKSMARGAEMPELRTSGQGIAAAAVKQLEDAVQTTARDAGVWDDLRAGRDATIAKWTAAETLDKLKAEPLQTFRMLTSAGDAAIERLREVQKLAPGEMKRIGRGVLDGMLDTATAEGGFGREAKLWADWQRLGPETKAILFPDRELRTSLDRFFQVGKMMAENPNPSGSALVGGLTSQGMLTLIDPVTGAATAIGGAALSSLLNSPKTARLLVDGMKTPRTASAARSLAARLKVAIRPSIRTAQATRSTTQESSR